MLSIKLIGLTIYSPKPDFNKNLSIALAFVFYHAYLIVQYFRGKYGNNPPLWKPKNFLGILSFQLHIWFNEVVERPAINICVEHYFCHGRPKNAYNLNNYLIFILRLLRCPEEFFSRKSKKEKYNWKFNTWTFFHILYE